MPANRLQIAHILLRHAHRSDPPESLPDDIRLIDGGLNLDSWSLLEAIIEIEDQLKVRLREEDLTLEALMTFGTFATFVEAHVG
jgi:acyl carrier protein